MATKAQAVAKASEHRCTLIDDGEMVNLIAPHGHVLACGTHECAGFRYARGEWKKADIWDEILYELATPPEKCEDPECEWCECGDILPFGVDPADVLCGCRVPSPIKE